MNDINSEKIFHLCPSLERTDSNQRRDAITRMCIAHVLNGGRFTGFLETAVEYLESLS